MSLVVFAAGCVTGLLSFSRVLRWLLSRQHDATMSMLCGFMLGSLYKLWPFQMDTTPDVEKFKHKVFKNCFPESFSGHVWTAIALCGIGIAVVLMLDVVSNRGSRKTATDAAA